MDKKYSILLVINAYDKHIQRLIEHLRSYNSDAYIAVWTTDYEQDVPNNIAELINASYTTHCLFKFGKKIPVIRVVNRIFSILRAVKVIPYNVFDVVNVHYPSFFQSFVRKDLKKRCNKLLVTPWGSDVYRVSRLQRFFLKKLFFEADIVTGSDTRFRTDFMKIMNVPMSKIANVDIGSDMIDYISSNINNIPVEAAKQKFGIKGQYVITCGYNGSPAQNHFLIFDEIKKIKTKLPSNLCLLLPMSYGCNKTYIEEVKRYLEKLEFNYVVVDSYLSVEELLMLRLATDMFVHMQKSDAKSLSVQEYLLANKIVVNAEWLRYRELEKYGTTPYLVAEDFSQLSNRILDACTITNYHLDENVKEQIEGYGWNKWIVKWDALYQTCRQ